MSKRVSIAVVLLFSVIVAFFLINRDNEIKFTVEEIEWLKKQDSLIYAANENAPPLRFVDDVDNQYKGVVVDYMKQLSLELGVDIQTVPMEWDEALLSLREGNTHICDMFINEERSEYYLFTDPIYNLRTVLLIERKEGFNLTDINNIRIATETGDYANSYLKENFPGAQLIFTRNVEEGFELFIKGEVDAVIGDEPIITYLLVERNENHNPNYSNIILYQQEVVLAVSKNKPELVPILNKAIEQTKNKGQLEQIQQKWFGISTPLMGFNETKIIKNIGIIASIAGLAFVFIALNNLQLQRQVKKRTKELELSRNELQIIFDGISDYMLVIDSNKRVLKINKSFADYLGITMYDTLGKNCNEFIGEFCNNDCCNCILDEVFSTKKGIRKEIMVGNEFYEINLQNLRDAENTLLITIKNITLDKINRNKMLQTNKMVAVGQLAAGMAHEIRNPLGIIRTQSYLIRINEKIDDSINKSVDYIDTAVNRASKIIDNILSFSRLSGNDRKLIDINKLVLKLIEMHNDIIKKKNIEVKTDSNIKEELLLNSESLEHIFLNLLSNSIDAIDKGGLINITTNIENNSIVIVCKDTGSGIKDDDMNNIYNPFFTTKELGKGTGLGLFIVYSEVEKLNGKIDVKSKFGQGTTFTIILPLEGKSD
jgi:polar amino acid transport system substrate-binding protein